MKLSHSKLKCILSNPAEYFLKYKVEILPKEKKKSLDIGSATHYGIENNTYNLNDYYNKKEHDEIEDNQIMAEALVYGYLYHKDNLFKELLIDENGEILNIEEEIHELTLETSLNQNDTFVGIIDLLLLTKRGFIIVDYKTSSKSPIWENYLDQLYRYIHLLKFNFKDVPIFKIAIINLRKKNMKRLKNENSQSYFNRLKKEYEINDDNLICLHQWTSKDFDDNFMKTYLDNLNKMCSLANLIDLHSTFYINYNSANEYGGSPYKSLLYREKDAYVLYEIKDKVYDDYLKGIKEIRDCKPLDMLVLDYSNILNKYEMFEAQALAFFTIDKTMNKDKLFKHLKKNFKTDDELLESYWLTLLYKIEHEEKDEEN